MQIDTDREMPALLWRTRRAPGALLQCEDSLMQARVVLSHGPVHEDMAAVGDAVADKGQRQRHHRPDRRVLQVQQLQMPVREPL